MHPPRPFAAALLLTLAGCGAGGGGGYAPPCPTAAILADGGDFSRYRGTSRDLTDLELSGRVLGISGRCRRGGEPEHLAASVAVRLRFARGPAAAGRTVQVPYFVAVTEGERVVSRTALVATATFAPNTDTVSVTTDDLDLDLPVSAEKSGAAYAVLVSFQLTPEQLRENRARR